MTKNRETHVRTVRVGRSVYHKFRYNIIKVAVDPRGDTCRMDLVFKICLLREAMARPLFVTLLT